VTNTNWENPTVSTFTEGSHTGTNTYTIGAFGVDYFLLGLTNPSVVTRVSRDASIGDTSFTNYWHAETTLDEIANNPADSIAQTLQVTATSQLQNLQRSTAIRQPQLGVISKSQLLSFPHLVGGVMAWKVNRTDYQLVGSTIATPDWTNIKAVRIVIETTGQCTAVLGSWQTFGDAGFCLSDTTTGYSYCYTLARLENGLPVAEGGPSPFSSPKKCQGAAAGLTIGFIGAPYTNLQGVTHYGIYRQGGVLNDAYLVDYFAINNQGISNAIYSDYSYSDAEIINNPSLTRNLWTSWPTAGVNAVSEPWQDRVFLGTGNQLFWSLPGQPNTIQQESQTTVSNTGDPIQGFSAWGPLVIVNQNSVYEMDGTVFEGPAQDWTLRKSGSRRGSAASKTIIKTPKGILLFGYDGMSLYYPGYGVDTPLDWVYNKIGDAWKGTSVLDPAAQKGYRVPAFNIPLLGQACATYGDGKIYLAAPTFKSFGDPTLNNTVFVFDLVLERVWYYEYPYTINSLFWDFVNNRLVAGLMDGRIVQLEQGLTDPNGFVQWGFRTKTWASPLDILIEGASVEAEASNGIEVRGSLDSVLNTMGTLTNTTRGWTPQPLAGQVVNNLAFEFFGTQEGTLGQKVSGLQWSAIVQPPKVTYWRTDFDPSGDPSTEKIWDCNFTEIAIQGSAPVIGVTFVDNVPVMTNTYPAPSSGQNYAYEGRASNLVGPVTLPKAYPNEILGNISYTTYTVGSGGTFQIFNSWNQTRPEPPRVLQYVSSKISAPSDSTIKTWVNEVHPLHGTITATLMVDGHAVAINTMTGDFRKSYEFGEPNVTVGNTVWVVYNASTPFKWYKTDFELEPRPFNKTTWVLTYKRPGGVTQLDMARFNSLDLEGFGTVTSTWRADGVPVLTNTVVVSGRQFFDVLSFPPGIRGYLFEQELTSSEPFRVWRSNLDIERIGVKGFSRVTYHGKPQEVAS